MAKNFLLFILSWSLTLQAMAVPGTLSPGSAGMVASTSDLASEIGAQVLRDGGNAVDATVAVGLALAVTWPIAGNLGGGGFALLRLPSGEAHFVDYREVAPKAAHENFYLDKTGAVVAKASTVGQRAAGVPGTPAGLELLHRRWGKLPWARLVEPARLLAAHGYPLNTHHVQAILNHKDLLQSFPESKSIFFPTGQDPKVGDLFIQKDLAMSLQRLKDKGAREFYQGVIAQRLVADQIAHQGVITAEDLAAYRPEVRTPLFGQFGDYQVITAPPPSSGGATLLQILTLLKGHALEEMGLNSPAYVHLLIEAMKRAFADRSEWYGDPAFVQVPLQYLLNPDYLKSRRYTISLAKATPSRDIAPAIVPPSEKPETTHFTVVDKDGMIVTNTYTLNGAFGAGVVARGTGILLNNEMDDFMTKIGSPNMFGLIQSPRNKIEPGKRPLSSMTPTIYVQDGMPVLALGSPGGPTIINTVLQVSLNVLVHGLPVQAAVDAPRFHHQWLPDEILYEPEGLPSATKTQLEQMGHVFTKNPRSFGDAQAVSYNPQTKTWDGGADHRLGGKAIAP